MKHVVLHVGLPKTGTSTLQNFLFANAERLKEHNVLYPKGLWDVKRRHPELAHSLLPDNEKKYKHVWPEVHMIIQQAKEPTIVLSSEAFSNLGVKPLKRLVKELEPYKVSVVAYLRRFDLWVESSYLQNIKSGAYTGTIKDFVDHMNPGQFYNKVAHWHSVFGKENVTVRLLDKEKVDDICLDFIDLIGLPRNGFESIPNSNVKPSLAQMVFLYHMNKAIAQTQGFKEEGFHRLDKPPISFFSKVARPFLESSGSWPTGEKYRVMDFETAENLLQSTAEWDKEMAPLIETQFPLFKHLENAYEATPLESVGLSPTRSHSSISPSFIA